MVEIKNQINNLQNSSNDTGIKFINPNIHNLTNSIGSQINRLNNTITISVPSLFNVNTTFIHIYFYLGFFNILLVLVSMLYNNFQYLGMILFLISLLFFTTLINRSKLIIEKGTDTNTPTIEKERVIFKDKVLYIDEIISISKGKYYNLYNFVDIFIKGELEPTRIFVKNEDDANNISKLKYF